MSADAIDKEMAYCFMQLSEAEKKSVLDVVKTFLQSRSSLFVDNYNNDIDTAIDEVQKGEFYSHDEVVSMAKKW